MKINGWLTFRNSPFHSHFYWNELMKNKKACKSYDLQAFDCGWTPLCRGTRIRTWDPLVPNQVHYRTVLYPENSAEGGGFEPPVPLRVRQFSKLVVSATHPSLQMWILNSPLGFISQTPQNPYSARLLPVSNVGANIEPLQTFPKPKLKKNDFF